MPLPVDVQNLKGQDGQALSDLIGHGAHNQVPTPMRVSAQARAVSCNKEQELSTASLP